MAWHGGATGALSAPGWSTGRLWAVSTGPLGCEHRAAPQSGLGAEALCSGAGCAFPVGRYRTLDPFQGRWVVRAQAHRG